MNKNFKNVVIHESTHEKARFLSKVQNKPISSTVEELINAVFQVACTYKQLNLAFETCITDSTILITCSGANRLIASSFNVPESMTEKNCSKRLHAEIEKAVKAKKSKDA